MRKLAKRVSCAQRQHDPPKTADDPQIDWSQILVDAVNKPGMISAAYTAFWNYSFGNQLLAMFECLSRGIEPGPIHTFKGWLNLNRHVKKGEKAITLCLPVSWVEQRETKKDTDPGEDATGQPAAIIRRRFIFRPHWFVLSQTDGEPYVPLVIPQWDERQACHVLMIDRIPFRHTDGNVQGYAQNREFAISPIAFLPHRTAFHEMAHIVLGHTAESMGLCDTDTPTPRDLREVEAEAVALICCQSLGLPGEQFSRGYLQHWLGSQKIEERSVHRIFKATDQILKAGRPQILEPAPTGPDTESDVPIRAS